MEQLEEDGVDADTAFNMVNTAERVGKHHVAVCTHTNDKKLISIIWDQGWWKV